MVTAQGTNNTISAIRFHEPQVADENALIDIGTISEHTPAPFKVNINATQATIFVRRQTAGQATTARIVVEDACGDWPTFVGGGPGAF